MATPSIPVFYKVRAFLRTAVEYWWHWTILFINLFVLSPLLVFTFLFLNKANFSFSLWLSYCHDYYRSLFPFIGFTASIVYTFRFGIWDRYYGYLAQILQKNRYTDAAPCPHQVTD